jgi:hypothetical protein
MSTPTNISEGKMLIVGETNRDRIGNVERSASGEGPVKLPFHKLIDFESGRRALEKRSLREEQSRARLTEQIRLPRLSGDLLELALTMAIFFSLVVGLYVGLIGSWPRPQYCRELRVAGQWA